MTRRPQSNAAKMIAALAGVVAVNVSLAIGWGGLSYFSSFYRLTLALLLNVCRTSLLTWIAAKKGTGAIAQYHDEAGITILFACTATLWGVSYLVSLLPRHASAEVKTNDVPGRNDDNGQRLHALKFLAISLIVWLVSVEVAERRREVFRGAKAPFEAGSRNFKFVALGPEQVIVTVKVHRKLG